MVSHRKQLVRVAVAVAILALALPLAAQAQVSTTILMGTVMQVTQVGNERFVQLDTNGNGQSDLLLQLNPGDTVLNAQGQPVAADQLQVGGYITVPTAQIDSHKGYYEIPESQGSAAGGSGTTAAAQVPLSGTVVQVSRQGNELVVSLDTNGDGTADIQIKLQAGDAVLGPNGQPVALSDIAVGSQISTPYYSYDASSGTFEAHSAAEQASSSNQGSKQDSSADKSKDGQDKQDPTADKSKDKQQQEQEANKSKDKSQGKSQDKSQDKSKDKHDNGGDGDQNNGNGNGDGNGGGNGGGGGD
ncbi:MAG TPA: hypothetical protein ENI60_03665 [Candidatus Fraserbacteria bacterium]|nr:hypothetical protein [Candidatus Fraserbacteria bacterium]